MVQSLRRWKLDILYSRCLKNNPEKNPWVFSGIFKQIQKILQMFFATDFFFCSRDGSKWHLNHSTFFNFQAFPWARRLSPLNLFRGFPPRTKGIACGGFGGRRSWSYVHRNGKWRGKLKLQVINVFMARKKGSAHWYSPMWKSNKPRESKVTAIFGLLSTTTYSHEFQTDLPDSSSVAVSCSTLAKCQTQCHFLHRTGKPIQLHHNLANFPPFSPTEITPPWILPSPTVGFGNLSPPKTCIIFFPKKKNNHPPAAINNLGRSFQDSSQVYSRDPPASRGKWEMWFFWSCGTPKTSFMMTYMYIYTYMYRWVMYTYI